METPIKKSDFVLTPYMKSSDIRATFQILNTIIPYVFLWFLAVKAAALSVLWLPPIIILLTLFSVRCFSLMHDCVHYSLFSSKKVNRCVGFGLGIINSMSQYSWARGHIYHHKTNGDWERDGGFATFLSTNEFARLNAAQQRRYELLRQPLMALPGGFLYLAIAPRLTLLMGMYDFISYLVTCLTQDPSMSLSKINSNLKSKIWQSTTEFWDLLLSNICAIGSWIILSYFLGASFFLGVYSIVLTLAGTLFICVAFVQHNFEGSYAHKTAGWDYLTGAIDGSSYLELPTMLKWFSANIGYHNIHHLSEKIPNYHLAACHQQNIHLLSNIKTIHIGDVLNCSKFILWDSTSNSLVSIASFRQDTVEPNYLNQSNKN